MNSNITNGINNLVNLMMPDNLLSPNEETKKEPIPQREYIWHDLRSTKRTKERGLPRRDRTLEFVDSLCFHQMAVHIRKPETCLNIPAHGAIIKNANIVLLNDPEKYMAHAHALNKNSIGIEISGREPGIIGEPKSFGLSASERNAKKTYEDLFQPISDEQVEAAKELCRYYIKYVEERGGKIKYVVAHRQGHESRVSDPGQRIWRDIVIPIMKEFGLTIGKTVGSGTNIPEIWDPSMIGEKYSWKVSGIK